MYVHKYLENMNEVETKKANFLLEVAKKLGMNLSGYKIFSIEQNNKYIILYVDGFDFHLQVSLDDTKPNVYCYFANMVNGNDSKILIEGKSLSELETWHIQQDMIAHDEFECPVCSHIWGDEDNAKDCCNNNKI